MHTLIINGGNIDDGFALDYMKNHPCDYLLAADGGIRFLKRNEIRPDEVVGDFDSAGEILLQECLNVWGDVPVQRFRPEKDATDMEIAMLTALERGSSEVTVLGATGTRLDHVLASIRILSLALEHGVSACIVDANNRIRLIDRTLRIPKETQFGKYVSLLVIGEDVEGLTLRGFYYPLTDHRMDAFSGLGISNEITEEYGEIRLTKGRLLVIESRD